MKRRFVHLWYNVLFLCSHLIVVRVLNVQFFGSFFEWKLNVFFLTPASLQVGWLPEAVGSGACSERARRDWASVLSQWMCVRVISWSTVLSLRVCIYISDLTFAIFHRRHAAVKNNEDWYSKFAFLHFLWRFLGRSLMIGWRKKSWNPERVPTVVTLSVCPSVCPSTTYRAHLLT